MLFVRSAEQRDRKAEGRSRLPRRRRERTGPRRGRRMPSERAAHSQPLLLCLAAHDRHVYECLHILLYTADAVSV